MKKLLSLILILFFIYSNLFSQVCNYKYRKRITFDPARVSGPSDLTNFPAMIKIASDNDLRVTGSGGYVENANGYDIIFTADDGVTQLNHQLEKYVSTTGALTVWVKIPTLSTSINTYIYMYYGNSAIVTDQSNTAVWNNYHGVWHLENNSFADNSGNGYTLTNNSTTNQSPAFINDGRANAGTNWLEVANTFPNITTSYSMSGWIYTTNNAKAGQRVFCDDVNNTGGYALSLGDGGTGMLRFYSRSSNPVILDGPANQIANNTWYYVVAVADITNGRKTIYVNGVQAATATFTNAWGTDAGNCSIGGETASGETANRLQGRIDEVRVAKSALSADWVATEYANQNSPTTFYSISAHPNVWLGGTTVWSTGSNWSYGAKPANNEDVIVPNTANQPVLDGNEQIYSIWIRPSATVSLSTNRLSIRFDVTNCGTLTSAAGGHLRMNGNAIQNQNLSGTGTYNLADLTINNTFATSPAVILGKDVNVSGSLTLTSGITYTTATNILALGTAATSTSGSATSFVSGSMSKAGTADFVFPVGKGTRWRRAAVTNISASTTFRVEYFNTPYSSLTPVNAPLNNVSQLEYWQIDRTVGAGNANITLYWEDASTSGITNCPDLTIARWNGTSWDERPGTASGTCSGTGSGTVLSNAAITAFSPFTFGSKSSSVNPLPIELLTFEAIQEEEKVNVKWITASEINNDYFVVDKTKDFIHFETVSTLDGAGNSVTPVNYQLYDLAPYNGLSYYRLKQVDFNGDHVYYPYVAVDYKSLNEFSFDLYPNPGSADNINLLLNSEKDKEVLVVLFDVNGKEVYSKVLLTSTDGENVYAIDPSSKISPGVYLVTATSNQNIYSKRLIIR
ncbi:MAG: DUF2341 domain-containing protein [Bacteroidetes bacterium]|nr:DUF2341 domain-containing protein [Bacteroidota bacterium]